LDAFDECGDEEVRPSSDPEPEALPRRSVVHARRLELQIERLVSTLLGSEHDDLADATGSTDGDLVVLIHREAGHDPSRAVLAVDPDRGVVLVANDDPLDNFLTFISTATYSIVATIKLDGTDPSGNSIIADGIEQCQWSPRTGKFYLAIPEVAGPGNNSVPGAVLEINPASMKVQKVFPIESGFVAGPPATGDCLGPQGLAIGPRREILLGCSNAGKGSVIINELDGSLVRNLPGLNGSDEVWYNPGDNHYFLAESNHTGGPILGVADQSADNGNEDTSATTAAGSHSVAADPVKNQVYVPGNNAASALCGGSTGCIAVFTTTNDDPGLCSGPGAPAHGQGKKGDPGFLRHVCPDNNGHPNVD